MINTPNLPSSFNPHTSTPDPDSTISIQWWCGLSFYQKEFIATYYQLPSSILSPYAILIAYKDRHDLRNLPGWPVTSFNQI